MKNRNPEIFLSNQPKKSLMREMKMEILNSFSRTKQKILDERDEKQKSQILSLEPNKKSVDER